MIARTWRARTTAAKAPAYAKHFTEAVAPHLKDLAGHKGAWLLQRAVHMSYPRRIDLPA